MAGYFTVDTAFWSDPDVADNYTPEDKYFYLYLLTCPNANISGCYEISTKQMSYDTGYSRETVERLIERFLSVHKVIDYSKENKEVLVCNWGKYHWTSSQKYIKALKNRIDEIKTEKFRKFLTLSLKNFENADEGNTVWIPYQYGMDTSFTFTLSSSVTSPDKEEEIGVQGEEGKHTAKKASSRSAEKPDGKFEEFAGDDAELLSALKEYEKIRNARKKPLTDRSKTMLVNKLRDKFPPEQWIAIIDQSILRGWDSFYPLKEDENWESGRHGINRAEGNGNVFFQNARDMVTNNERAGI